MAKQQQQTIKNGATLWSWWNNEWIHFSELPKDLLLVESTMYKANFVFLFVSCMHSPFGCCCHFNASLFLHVDLLIAETVAEKYPAWFISVCKNDSWVSDNDVISISVWSDSLRDSDWNQRPFLHFYVDRRVSSFFNEKRNRNRVCWWMLIWWEIPIYRPNAGSGYPNVLNKTTPQQKNHTLRQKAISGENPSGEANLRKSNIAPSRHIEKRKYNSQNKCKNHATIH